MYLTGITVLFSTIYVVGQQIVRQSANMPQIGMAQTVAAELNNGANPVSLTAGPQINMETNQSPFVIIYDKHGLLVASSAELGGTTPAIPVGVLQASGTVDFNPVTWQPQTGIRIASVTVSANKYYVVVGRSLSGPEKIGNLIAVLVVFGYSVSLTLVGSIWLLSRVAVRNPRKARRKSR